MKNNPHTSSMNATPDHAELEIIREEYLRNGENFAFLITPDPGTGYFVEPWSNECLMGQEMAPGQPKPVSLDQSDDEIAEHEKAIREWIGEQAHRLVVEDANKQAPKGWTLKSHAYDADWPDTEFGASILVFTIT